MDQFLDGIDINSEEDVQHAVDRLSGFVRENDSPRSSESADDAGLSIACLSTMLDRLEISKVEELSLLVLKVLACNKISALQVQAH